jgi:ascorbate-specific PTS system EIIC-type component UlaA
MPDLTPVQIAIVQRLIAHGFTPVAFPLYANAMGIRRGSFAALLVPVDNATLEVLGEPCYLIGLNLAVRTRCQGRPCFVWKQQSVEATPELLQEHARFSADIAALLSG